MNNNDNAEMERPEMPEMNCESESENCERPELPEGMDGEAPSDMKGGMQGGFGGRGEFVAQASNANSDASWHPAAYLAFGAGSVILGIFVSYACFSKFFHLKPGQTFSSATKFIWFIVAAAVIATGLCVLGYFIPVWTA